MADLVRPGHERSRDPMRPGARFVALMACGLVVNAAAGERSPIADPTLPPPGYGPLRPGGEAGAPPPAAPDPVRLQMIARSGNARLAVLNGRSVHPGDELTVAGRNVKVVAIHDDSVVLQQDGHRQTLELTPHTGANPACAGSAPPAGACRRDPPGASR